MIFCEIYGAVFNNVPELFDSVERIETYAEKFDPAP